MLSEKEIEALLPEYASGNVSADQGRQIDEWICQSSANRIKAQQYMRLEHLGSRMEAIDSADTENALKRLHAGFLRDNGRKALRFATVFAAVCSIPLLIVSVWMAIQLSSGRGASQVELRSTTGMTAQTTLPDGSRVWLNSNSTLSYPSRFGQTREVTLEGEGYFEVAKDPGRKFFVHAGSAKVEVTGTEFDVEAYSDKYSEVRTTLLSGSVILHVPAPGGRERTMAMSPGQQCTFSAETGRLTRRQADGAGVTAWKDGKTVLDNTSLEEALRAIGNRFNVEFLVRNESLLDNRYTGTFSGQTLEVVLEHFKRTTNIHFDSDFKGTNSENVSGRQVIIVY